MEEEEEEADKEKKEEQNEMQQHKEEQEKEGKGDDNHHNEDTKEKVNEASTIPGTQQEPITVEPTKRNSGSLPQSPHSLPIRN